MELRIIKPSFKYVAGQWLFIQVPDVSGFQWHPVSCLNRVLLHHDANLYQVYHHVRS